MERVAIRVRIGSAKAACYLPSGRIHTVRRRSWNNVLQCLRSSRPRPVERFVAATVNLWPRALKQEL